MIYRFYFILFFVALTSCKKEQESLPFFNTADFTPEWISQNSETYKSIHKLPEFSFFDQDGESISTKTIEGKIVVADFFFTVCPGICPRLTKNMSSVQKAFQGDNSVVLLSHSVTPEMDSIPVLKAYAQNHKVNGDQWHLLTGNRKAIYTLARLGYFADEEVGLKKSDNEFLHTENFILLDGSQRIRGVYNGTNPTEVERLIEDITVLKNEVE